MYIKCLLCDSTAQRSIPFGCSPFIGYVSVAGVQQDWLGCLTGVLSCRGIVQKVPHDFPEDRAIGVPLLEVKGSRACTILLLLDLILDLLDCCIVVFIDLRALMSLMAE